MKTVIILLFLVASCHFISQDEHKIQFVEKEIVWRNDTLVFLQISCKANFANNVTTIDIRQTTRYSMRIEDPDCQIMALDSWTTSDAIHGTFLIDDLERMEDSARIIVQESTGYIDQSQEYTFDYFLSSFQLDAVTIEPITSDYPKADLSWYYGWREENTGTINFRPSPCRPAEPSIYSISPISEITSENLVEFKPITASGTVYQTERGDSSYPIDSLTYDQYVGEFIAGSNLANGWRIDTINGGYNKQLYWNPYTESLRFQKEGGREMAPFRYKDGELYTGKIEDTIIVNFTPNKIKGYLYGKPYYESEEITAIFRGECVNGQMQGRGVLAGIVRNSGIYGILFAECEFKDGEIIGETTYWDLNSVNYHLKDGVLIIDEEVYDYLSLKAMLNYSIITYEKGSGEWKTWIDYNAKGKVIEKRKNK
jgi:hypothetical protein